MNAYDSYLDSVEDRLHFYGIQEPSLDELHEQRWTEAERRHMDPFHIVPGLDTPAAGAPSTLLTLLPSRVDGAPLLSKEDL